LKFFNDVAWQYKYVVFSNTFNMFLYNEKYFEFSLNNAILNTKMFVLFYIKFSFNNVFALDS